MNKALVTKTTAAICLALIASACDNKKNDITYIPEPTPSSQTSAVVNETVSPSPEPSATPVPSQAAQIDYAALINETPPPKPKKAVATVKSSDDQKLQDLGIRVVGIAGSNYRGQSDSVAPVTGTESSAVNPNVVPEKVVRPEVVEPPVFDYEALSSAPVETVSSSYNYSDTYHPPQKDNPSLQDVESVMAMYSSAEDAGTFTITAYDLSIESCGKAPGDLHYGDTASGYNLVDHTRESAMTVAVDPNVIPLGTKLYLLFEGPYSHFSGLYTARDTGSAIKQRKIDLFLGDFHSTESSPKTWAFGKRSAKVFIVK